MPAVLTLLSVSVTYAQEIVPPPAWPVPDIRSSEMKSQPITGATLGRLHVVLEKTTFSEVSSALGYAPFGRQGDAGEFLMWVCYTSPRAHARVWLTSSEMGGEKYIDGIVVKQLLAEEAPNSQCPSPILQTTRLTIDNGIGLGVTTDKIEAILGEPNKAPASILYYSYEGKDGEFDVSSVLALRIQGNRVVELHATHTSTN